MPRIFISIILFLGTATVGLFYLGPAWQEFSRLSKETRGLQEISVELDELISSRDALVGLINTISKEDLRRIDQALPQGSRAGELLVMLENLALKSGLVIKKIDLASSAGVTPVAGQPRPGGIPAGTERAKGPINEFPFSFSVAGSYESIKVLLRAVEKTVRIMDTQEVSFNVPAKADAIEFSLKARAYYQ